MRPLAIGRKGPQQCLVSFPYFLQLCPSQPHHFSVSRCTGRSRYPPPPGPNQAFHGSSNFVDGSGPLFSMYVERATEYDRRMTNSWKGDADGILVFTGLFSAAVASLAAVSVQDLRPNSQDTSAYYLANIYQLLAAANGTHVPIPSTLLDPLAPFSPPTHAIWVNTFWFLSLVISLTCALLATLLQQWARRYIKITQPRYSPDKHARIRAFFSEGVERLHLPWAVEALPALLHISLFLFFSGLLVFLSNIHHTVFSAAAWWIGLCVATYTVITVMPIFRHDSPYYAPLSTSAWYLVSGTLFFLFRTLHHSPFFRHSFRMRFSDLKDHYCRWFSLGLSKITEETAREPSQEMDGRLLTWTFNSLDEDIELERFFSSIPGLCSSKVVMDPHGTFVVPNEDKLVWALIGLMDRTLASQLVPNTIKQRRSGICVKAMDAASLPLNDAILDRVFSEEWDGVLSSVELGLFLRRKVDYSDPGAASYSQCAISIIISREQERNSRWFELATGHLGVSGSVLRNYLEHGDSVSLFNCIYVTRYMIDVYCREGWRHSDGSKSKTLESVTKFDIRRTLPDLQQDFCRLWNDTVRKAQNPAADCIRLICILALKHIRNAYISLHRETSASPNAFSAHTDIDDPILDDPLSYPLCDVESHCHIPPACSTLPSTRLPPPLRIPPELLPTTCPPSRGSVSQ
ncbi:hypothetical protein BC826DRAFT_1120995 [Russula brevipes]|nr:hypothetical protein BC826DRAFT_1120995 [Russula brevipes]